MRLTFLGTSHGIPEANRRRSCVLLETGGCYYFFDMGMDAVCELINRGIAIDDVKGVFITHMHGDHVNGLISFAELLSWKFKTADPAILLPEEAGVGALKNWVGCTDEMLREDIRISSFAAGVIFDDGTLKVTAVATKHIRNGEKPSFAFFAEAEGKKVLFTGDLRGPSVDFPEISQPVDLIVCEGAHFSALEYKPLFARGIAKRYCITHYVPWNIPNMFALKKELPDCDILTATDGLELTV